MLTYLVIASNAQPVPVAPPPMTRMSYGLSGVAFERRSNCSWRDGTWPLIKAGTGSFLLASYDRDMEFELNRTKPPAAPMANKPRARKMLLIFHK